jgi:flagellin-like protein
MRPDDTIEQLRADIDSGRTGDKVSASDPAMAPLGTDDEAAGTPPSPAGIALTRRLETRPHRSKPQTGLGGARILIAIVIALGAAIVGWGFLLGSF